MSKSKNTAAINALNGEQLIARLDDLVAARETWENGTNKASNEELCTLLERCTTLLLEVQADRSLVLKIGKQLEERGLKDRANTSLATKIVRIVFGNCGKRAFTYAKVITVAAAEKRENESMLAFVQGHGGIEEISRGDSKGKSKIAKDDNITFAVKTLNLSKPLIPAFDMVDALRPHTESAFSFSLAVIRRDANGKASVVFGINNKALVNSALAHAGKQFRPKAEAEIADSKRKNRLSKRQGILATI